MSSTTPRRKRFIPRYTRIGVIFISITVLVSIAAFNTGNNPLYLLFGMMLSLIVISGVLSEAMMRGLQVRRQLPERLIAGQEVLISLSLRNHKSRLPSFSILIRDRILGIDRPHRPSIYCLRVDPGSEVSQYYRFAFPHRGRWTLEGFEVSTSFPFELFRKWREIDQPVEVIVYPQPALPPPLPYLGSSPRGSQPQPRQGSEGDFFGLRDYRTSDDFRQIHWKLSAKRGQLITRELERREAQALTICFYNAWIPAGHSSSWQPPDPVQYRQQLEQAVEQCAGLAQHLMQQGHPVALVTLEGRTGFGSDAQHLDRLWRILAIVPIHGDPDPVVSPEGDQLQSWQSTFQPQEQCLLIAPGSSPPSISPGQKVAWIPV